MLTILPPSPLLARAVLSYWFIQDMAGSHQGKPIRTAPHSAPVLTINFGQPNTDSAGMCVPKASLLGLQTRARTWISGPETYFVMVMLTPQGLISLFPHVGSDVIDGLLDLGSFIGDRETHHLLNDLSAAWAPQRIKPRLDRWLLRRIEMGKDSTEPAQFAIACDMLAQNQTVHTVADEIGISRRGLHRWFHSQFGVGPKEYALLHRLQASLTSVQTRCGDPVASFSDQAHQIREWKRRLGVTPGAYRQTSLAHLAVRNGGTVSSRGAVTHYF